MVARPEDGRAACAVGCGPWRVECPFEPSARRFPQDQSPSPSHLNLICGCSAEIALGDTIIGLIITIASGVPGRSVENHSPDTEDTEFWFLPSLLRDLRASVVDLHLNGVGRRPM